MGTLLVGLLVVTAGAVGFGLALFGRRPVPQPATGPEVVHLGPERATPRRGGSPWDRIVGSLPAAVRHRSRHDRDDVVVTGWERTRAALLLGVTILGLAALIGAALSIVVVGLVLVAT